MRLSVIVAVAVAASLSALPGCASPRPAPRDGASVPEALATFGALETRDFPGETGVVLIADRHATGAGIALVDESLRALQRDHHEVLAWLVAHDFHLLACESPLGPLPDNALALRHADATRDLLETGGDLNQWSIYQPIRHAVEFGAALTVRGIEDPVLYAADVASLDRLVDVHRALRRPDWTTGPTEAQLTAEDGRLRAQIRSHVKARGAAAARNLTTMLAETKTTHAVVLIGAAHVPSLSEALAAAHVRHWVFRSPNLKPPTDPTSKP